MLPRNLHHPTLPPGHRGYKRRHGSTTQLLLIVATHWGEFG